MGSFKVFDRQARRFVAAVALLLASVAPALVPALASAATVTERSVALSTSAKATSDVGYEVKFKTTATATSTGAFLVDFCTTAAIGDTCTTPTGLDVGTPTTTSGHTVTGVDANTVKVVLSSAKTANQDVTVDLTDLTTPDDPATIYARIVTYADETSLGTNDSDNPGDHVDDGSVALAITDSFAVSGAVLESLVFCASAPDGGTNPIDSNCNPVAGKNMTTPNVSLGTNGILGSALSEGTIYSQISTNAAHGAVVKLRNSAAGGGLKRVEAAGSDIGPFTGSPVGTAAVIPSDAAKFGLKLGGLTAATGAVQATNNYGTGGYMMNYDSNNETGVTSPYGDTIYTTSGAPVNSGSVDLTFGANMSPTTPAGNYSATLNLIATGTF